MIEFSDVSFSWTAGQHQVPVFDRLNVVLPTDRRLVILGHHGSGKSSLVQLIAGVQLPSAGTITRYARVSFPVGHGGGFREKLTLRQNLSYLADLYGADPDEVTGFVISVTGMAPFLDEELREMPRNRRPYLHFAAGYAIPFDAYLLDNIIAVGDPGFRKKCIAMFERRAKTAGILLATSNPVVAKRYADVVAILYRGSIKLYTDIGEAAALFENLRHDLVAEAAATEETALSEENEDTAE